MAAWERKFWTASRSISIPYCECKNVINAQRLREKIYFILEMDIMRKAICLILVLVVCLSMALPVFATNAPSAGGGSGSGTPGCTIHKDADNDGFCDECGKAMSTAGSAAGNPRTGDIIMMWVIIMLVALAAIAAAVVIYRKKFA